MVSLLEAKLYLKLESEEEDTLVSSFLDTAKQFCLDILRKTEEELSDEDVPIFSTGVLYAVSYLYEHRELADHKALKETLYHLLLSQRKEGF